MSVAVWLAAWPLNEVLAAETKAELTPSESQRFDHIQLAPKRSEYLASRYVLRHALNHRFARQSPKSWQITEQTKAAPVVDNAPRPCYVSLSHSGDRVAVALADAPLGVDLERVREVPQLMAIADRVFSEYQCQALKKAKDSDAKQALFYRYWTEKEALYKAHSQSGQAIAFFSRADLSDSPFRRRYYTLSQYALCLAYSGKTDEVSLHRLDR